MVMLFVWKVSKNCPRIFPVSSISTLKIPRALSSACTVASAATGSFTWCDPLQCSVLKAEMSWELTWELTCSMGQLLLILRFAKNWLLHAGCTVALGVELNKNSKWLRPILSWIILEPLYPPQSIISYETENTLGFLVTMMLFSPKTLDNDIFGLIT